MTNGN